MTTQQTGKTQRQDGNAKREGSTWDRTELDRQQQKALMDGYILQSMGNT